jgi:Na+/H+-dicarboxylate symporter
MDFKRYLMPLALVAMAHMTTAADLISNETWQSIVNMLPYISLLVVGIVGIFFVVIPLIIILKVISFLSGFLDKILHILDKSL